MTLNLLFIFKDRLFLIVGFYFKEKNFHWINFLNLGASLNPEFSKLGLTNI